MEVFIRFLLDNLAIVIITGLVVLGIIGLSVTLIVCKVKEKKKAALTARPAGETAPENKTD